MLKEIKFHTVSMVRWPIKIDTNFMFVWTGINFLKSNLVIEIRQLRVVFYEPVILPFIGITSMRRL